MREIARRAGGLEIIELTRAEGSDTCLRVAVAASAPIVARLVDASGDFLAVASRASTAAVLGERGPVCVRRSDVVTGAADGPAGTRVRWIVWRTP